MIIVAHPDDIEYGSASAVARWVQQGKSVTEVIATRGEAGIQDLEPARCAVLRVEEQVRSARLLGVDGVEFLDHPDGTLEYGLPLRRDLARAIRRHRPDVLTSMNFRDHWPGGTSYNHADHRVLGMALLDAVRDAGNPWVFQELLEEDLQPWTGVRFVAFAASPFGRHFTNVTGNLDAGIESLAAHEIYLNSLPEAFDPATFLREIAEGVGRDAGVEHAVLFEMITT